MECRGKALGGRVGAGLRLHSPGGDLGLQRIRPGTSTGSPLIPSLWVNTLQAWESSLPPDTPQGHWSSLASTYLSSPPPHYLPPTPSGPTWPDGASVGRGSSQGPQQAPQAPSGQRKCWPFPSHPSLSRGSLPIPVAPRWAIPVVGTPTLP